MKKLILAMLLVSGLFAFDVCQYHYDKMKKANLGMYISGKDADLYGFRASHDNYRYHSKNVLLECKGGVVDFVRKQRIETDKVFKRIELRLIKLEKLK